MTGLPFPFRCEVIPERERERVRIALVGELDAATSDEVRATVAELRRSGFDRFVIDFSDLSFIDSSGLKVILELHAAGIGLELIPGPPPVQRIFTITGTFERLPFRES